MDDIRHAVRGAARRIGLDRATRVLGQSLIALGAFVCLVIVADRLIFLGTAAALLILAGLALALAAAAGVAIRRWPREFEAALELDGRLHLAERVSTALAVDRLGGPMACAVVDDASAYARNVPVSETFPLRLHREFLAVAGLAAAALVLAAWMPQFDLLGARRRADERRDEREAVQRQASAMRRDLVQLQKRVPSALREQAATHLDRMQDVIGQMERGELNRAEAMAKLSELGESLKELSQGLAEKGRVPPAVAHKAGADITRDLAEALAQKDFAAAAEELKRLAREASADEALPEKRDALCRELGALAKALEGCPDLSEAIKRLASALAGGESEALRKCLENVQLELDEQADLEAELALLKACEGMCKGGKAGLSEVLLEGTAGGVYTRLDGGGAGPGMRGPGIGAGGTAPVQPEAVEFGTARLKGQIRPGRVVAQYFADGQQLKGEARVEYSQDVEAARTEAAQALEGERIPPAYQDLVRDYFQRMKTD